MTVTVPNLKAIRTERLLTMRDLEHMAHVSRATLVKLERGGRAYPSTVRKLAAALGVDPHILVGGIGSWR